MPKSPYPKSYQNRVFTVTCPFQNVVILTQKTWEQHSIPGHSDQDLVGNIEHVKAAVVNPDRARRSTDPHHGAETCIYERVHAESNFLVRVPVIFDSPEYDKGFLLGRIMTAFMLPPSEWESGQVGEIFWVRPAKEKDEKS